MACRDGLLTRYAIGDSSDGGRTGVLSTRRTGTLNLHRGKERRTRTARVLWPPSLARLLHGSEDGTVVFPEIDGPVGSDVPERSEGSFGAATICTDNPALLAGRLMDISDGLRTEGGFACPARAVD